MSANALNFRELSIILDECYISYSDIERVYNEVGFAPYRIVSGYVRDFAIEVIDKLEILVDELELPISTCSASDEVYSRLQSTLAELGFKESMDEVVSAMSVEGQSSVDYLMISDDAKGKKLLTDSKGKTLSFSRFKRHFIRSNQDLLERLPQTFEVTGEELLTEFTPEQMRLLITSLDYERVIDEASTSDGSRLLYTLLHEGYDNSKLEYPLDSLAKEWRKEVSEGNTTLIFDSINHLEDEFQSIGLEAELANEVAVEFISGFVVDSRASSQKSMTR